MDDQHRQISGYRDLSQDDIATMNGVKAQEAVVNGMLDYLRGLPDVDGRQVALAATKFEEAFMHATRAIAKPARITAKFWPSAAVAALQLFPPPPAADGGTAEAVDAAFAGQRNGAGISVAATANVELDPVTGQPKPKASEQP